MHRKATTAAQSPWERNSQQCAFTHNPSLNDAMAIGVVAQLVAAYAARPTSPFGSIRRAQRKIIGMAKLLCNRGARLSRCDVNAQQTAQAIDEPVHKAVKEVDDYAKIIPQDPVQLQVVDALVPQTQ